MPFVHELFDRPVLEQITRDDGVRHYRLPTGEMYPSVTTMLSARDSSWLEDWKKRVGEDQAREIAGQAKVRGTAIHNIAEKYLLNDPAWTKGAASFNLTSFRKIKPLLDADLSKIYGIEIPLYSHHLKTAGTCDLIGVWKGKPAILDFKTSTRIKKEEKIENYFIQTTAYSLMVEELFGLRIDSIVIMMIVDHEHPLLFEKDRSEYLDRVNEIFVRNRPL